MSAAAPPDRYVAQVAAALDAVAVRPPGAFLWFGRRVAASGVAPAAGDDALGRARLVDAIARRLHTGFFGDGAPRPQRAGPVTAPDDGGAFVRSLAQANCGRGAWEAGWVVGEVEAGDARGGGDLHEAAAGEAPEAEIAVIRADGLRVLAPAGDVRLDGGGATGAPAVVRVPKELRGFSPGFYIALGDTPAPFGAPPGTDRVGLYWTIAAPGAVTFVSRLTYALNRASVPFSLRLLDNPARYGRREPAVLLLAKADYAAAITLLRPLLRALTAHLADGAPAFTKPLARGLAVAEQPAGARSFGEHRCHVLAEAIVAASERGLSDAEQRLDAVGEHFAAAGVSLDAPYLQPGSDDAYLS